MAVRRFVVRRRAERVSLLRRGSLFRAFRAVGRQAFSSFTFFATHSVFMSDNVRANRAL